MSKKRILTGYRPTGRLTLGHWFGNLLAMRELQEEYEAYYFVADWHALTSDWQDTHCDPSLHRGNGAGLGSCRNRPFEGNHLPAV